MPDDDKRGSAPRDFGAGRSLGAPADREERDGFDVPEWVSEFRRLYVEPKTRATLKDEEAQRRRRPAASTNGAAAATANGQTSTPLPVEQPLSDEPLRSRSEVHRARTEVHRGRRSAEDGRPSRHEDHEPTSVEAVPVAGRSRAELRRAREERARAQRRMRLRRTIVVGVVLLVVAVVVTWLLVRNQQPVSASAASLVERIGPAVTAGPLTPGVASVGGAAATAGVTPGVVPAAGDAAPLPTAAVLGGSEALTSHRPTPSSTPTPTPPPVAHGTGRLSWVDWGRVANPRTAGGTTVRVALEMEGGLGVDPAETAASIARILVDPRGWQTQRDIRFVFVTPEQARRGAYDLRVALASRTTTTELCRPLDTEGFTSCYNGRVVLNLDRWMLGVEAYAGHLDEYRTYVVDHEVGHSFGLGHDGCPEQGKPATVMVPQTLHLWGCLPYPYPVTD